MILKDYYQENRIHFRHYFLLLIICLLAYWPLTFGVFSVKNDAIHYFLPYRFHISEALHNGEGPFWSPYIYMGYPVQGDMQSGAWNPFVWLFSLFGRYNLTIFHFENLLYIFLGGVGMYKLTNRFCDHGKTALLTGVAYMLSGFMLSGQLINWLASAAFIPFVIHYFLLLLQTGRLNAAVKGGISLYLLLTAGYPSFFIMTGYLLLILFAVSLWGNLLLLFYLGYPLLTRLLRGGPAGSLALFALLLLALLLSERVRYGHMLWFTAFSFCFGGDG